ncbi:cytochrome P450 [Boletus reticuloceps]|uniref:Cytochrome P450 n=1 Tax=Boletus reticuloceps TaxID=495285 RepID=A0A8I2YPR9_9AGAM|nr:cytochrome P450 [Boletus reticuloceps]
MHFPPSLAALVRIIPRLLFAPAAVYISFQVFEALVGERAPWQWLRISAYLLVFPATFVTKLLYTHIRDRRHAGHHGAVIPPSIKYRWPGALDKLSALVWNFSNGYIAEYGERECEENGNTFNFYVLYENRIFTTEPEYIKAMLATQFSSYEKGPVSRDQFDSLLGAGVFNSDADIWKFHRTMTRPFFTRDRISDFDIFEKHAEDAIRQMKIRMRQGYSVDFQDVVSRFTLDSATEFLFGKAVCSLSAGIVYPPSSSLSKDPAFLNHPSNRFFRAFTESQIATANRTNYGSSWRLAEPWRDQVQKHMKVCLEFVDPIIADTLAKKHEQRRLGLDAKEGMGEAKDGETLLEHLVNYTEDQKVLRDEAVNIMIAGRDTTAGTLTFAVYMLSQHPDVIARLREEIITKIGLSRRPTHDDIREMKYLRAFINEILRLYPSVPFNVRCDTGCSPALLGLIAKQVVYSSTDLASIEGRKALLYPPKYNVSITDPHRYFDHPNPIYRITYCVFLMHRRKDLWGPDADLFDPDRFLDERLHKYLTPNSFIFLPFGAGPRICLGQQFAYNEISYFLIRLLQSIDAVSLDMETQRLPPSDWAQAKGRKALEKVILRSHLTMYVQGGLWVRMKEVDPADFG